MPITSLLFRLRPTIWIMNLLEYSWAQLIMAGWFFHPKNAINLYEIFMRFQFMNRDETRGALATILYGFKEFFRVDLDIYGRVGRVTFSMCVSMIKVEICAQMTNLFSLSNPRQKKFQLFSSNRYLSRVSAKKIWASKKIFLQLHHTGRLDNLNETGIDYFCFSQSILNEKEASLLIRDSEIDETWWRHWSESATNWLKSHSRC